MRGQGGSVCLSLERGGATSKNRRSSDREMCSIDECRNETDSILSSDHRHGSAYTHAREFTLRYKSAGRCEITEVRASEGSLPHSHGPSWCHSCIADDRRGDMVTAVRAIRSSCTHGGAAGLPGLTQAEHRPLASPDCKRPETSRGVGCPAGLDGSEALAHQAFGDRLHLPVEAAHTHDGRANARALAALADHSEAVTLIEGALRAAGQ